jgi:hypothetical protein
MGGLTLQHFTAMHITAKRHCIVPLKSGTRIGVPFLMRASPDRPLDCSLLNDKVCKRRGAFLIKPRCAREIMLEGTKHFKEEWEKRNATPVEGMDGIDRFAHQEHTQVFGSD